MHSPQNIPPPRIAQQLRHYLVLLLLAFSFGGFTFYAAVVVPIGGDVFDATAQGFVTRRVTRVLNVAHLITLAALVWEGVQGRDARSPVANRSFALGLTVMGVCLLVLWFLHPQLDGLLEDPTFSVIEPDRFYQLHRVYLWGSTIHWLATLTVAWLFITTGEKTRSLETETQR